MINTKLLGSSAAIFLCLLFSACSSGGGSDSSGDAGSGADADGFKSSCGVLANGSLYNPVAASRGEAVQILFASDSNTLTLQTGSGEKLVKLLGLDDTTSFNNTAAKKLIDAYAGQNAYFFSDGCSAEVKGGTAEVGQVVTEGGVNISELIVGEHVGGNIEATGSCGESNVASCYADLAKGEIANSDREVKNFLWKPNSESPYNPDGVSILFNPCAKVLVNGSEVRDYGPSNGRCVTARLAETGCSFGANVKVEVLDKTTGEPYTFNGQPSFTIANGCNRTEFGAGAVHEEGETVACSPATSEFRYIPAAEQCGGNAAVVVSGSLKDAFSIQLRLPDGGDRLDEDCAEASCSPYKVQRYINSDTTKTACFGAPGTAVLMTNLHHSSVKRAGDDRTPPRFCIPDPTVAVN